MVFQKEIFPILRQQMYSMIGTVTSIRSGNEIKAFAQEYKFAEQVGFTEFANFPYSAYPPLGLGTNSNTFVREMLRLAGITMKRTRRASPWA